MSEKAITKPDEEWELRAQDKFNLGEWTRPPFWNEAWFRKPVCDAGGPPCFCSGGVEAWPQQYAHIEDGDVVFYASVQHGMRHRVTVMRPGRYLTKYFSALTPEQIEQWAGACTAMKHGLQFATKPMDIVRVYTSRGPANDSRSSTGSQPCMSHPETEYSCEGHPVRVYGAGDLAVAYAMDPAAGEVIGRALVWPERKIYGRLYGNATMFGRLLRDAGFEPDAVNGEAGGGFDGAKLLLIKQGNCVVCPYLDYGYGIRVVGDHLEMCEGEDSEADAQSTCGLVDLNASRCEFCDQRLGSGGYSARSASGRSVSACSRCVRDMYTCAYCDLYHDADSSSVVWSYGGTNRQRVCATCYDEAEWVMWHDGIELNERHQCTCEECGEVIPVENPLSCPCRYFRDADVRYGVSGIASNASHGGRQRYGRMNGLDWVSEVYLYNPTHTAESRRVFVRMLYGWYREHSVAELMAVFARAGIWARFDGVDVSLTTFAMAQVALAAMPTVEMEEAA